MRGLIGFVIGMGLVFVLASAQKQSLELRVSQLEKKVQELRTSNLRDALDKWANLKIGEQGFSVAKTEIGALGVKLTDVQPFASGCRVIVQVFNLTSATLRNTDFAILWERKKGEALKTTYQELKDLPPGIWVEIEVQNAQIAPQDLSGLQIHIEPNIIAGQ